MPSKHWHRYFEIVYYDHRFHGIRVEQNERRHPSGVAQDGDAGHFGSRRRPQ